MTFNSDFHTVLPIFSTKILINLLFGYFKLSTISKIGLNTRCYNKGEYGMCSCLCTLLTLIPNLGSRWEEKELCEPHRVGNREQGNCWRVFDIYRRGCKWIVCTSQGSSEEIPRRTQYTRCQVGKVFIRRKLHHLFWKGNKSYCSRTTEHMP